MKNIYIILTQSGTLIAKTLKFVTKDKYNHSSICLNSSFDTFYSFGRKNPYLVLPGGFVQENPCKGLFARFNDIPCMILEKEVTDEQYEKLETLINKFIINEKNYSYAIISLFLADTKYTHVSNNKYFCSQFVSKLLSEIGISIPKAPEHMHPYDFTKIEDIKVIYEGDLKKFCKNTAY